MSVKSKDSVLLKQGNGKMSACIQWSQYEAREHFLNVCVEQRPHCSEARQRQCLPALSGLSMRLESTL